MKTKLHSLISSAILLATLGNTGLNAQNTFPATGNVGIGTTTPTLASLVVESKNGATHAVFGSKTTGVSIESNWPGLGFNSYYNTRRTFLSNGYANSMNVNPNDGTFYFQASSAAGTTGQSAVMKTLMTVSRAGSVNISGTDAGYIFSDRVQNNYSGFNWYATGGKAKLYRYGFGGDLLAIDSLGRMGIGNNNPTMAGLTVDSKAGAVNAVFGSNTTGVAIESSYPGIGFNTYYNNGRKFISGGYGGYIGVDPTNGLLALYNTSASGSANANVNLVGSLVLTAAGNVGIGTTSPANKLDVCGTIRAKEVVVQTGWCDYVFDKEYKLRSLNEVESYIAQNKHLPDVPSATEVENKGVQVAQMDSILIKKVEELTLYVIDQNKQIQQLHKKIVQLESTEGDKKN